MLDRVLQAGQELTDTRYAALGLLNESKTELTRFLTRGIDKGTHAAIGQLPRGRGVLGALIKDPAPLRLTDIGEHPRSHGFPHAHPLMQTVLEAPSLVDGAPFGNLYLTEKACGAEFSDADEQAARCLGRPLPKPSTIWEEAIANARALITDLRSRAFDAMGGCARRGFNAV